MHAHPSLLKAISGQFAKGTHYGAECELALEWAEKSSAGHQFLDGGG